jgi:HAMP domain-containing protein
VDATSQSFQMVTTAMIGVAIAVGIGLLFLSQRALRRLADVTRAIEQVAQGDLDARPGENGVGEVGELQRAAANMVATLRANRGARAPAGRRTRRARGTGPARRPRRVRSRPWTRPNPNRPPREGRGRGACRHAGPV